MIRIRFPTDEARVQGNYLLATQSVVRRLRGQVFEVFEAAIKLLDAHQIPYETLPIHEKAQVTITPTSTWVQDTYGILIWTGDPEELRRLALGPAFDLDED